MSAISVRHISKSYGDIRALNSVSFEVDAGELFGLIGPDGAGKSTLFRILTTLLVADQGGATVAGHDVIKDYRAIRKEVGYMPGRFSLYQDLSVEENLAFFATIFGATIDQNYDLIREIYEQIAPFKDRLAGKLSGGMKQKLALCCALIHKPKVLFLDEPTTGVDAVSRKEFWQMLKLLVKKGITILVSTPYMDEAGLCDRIALIQDGQILRIDTPDDMVRDYPGYVYAVRSTKNYDLLKRLRREKIGLSVLAFGDCLHLTSEADIDVAMLENDLKGRGYDDITIQKIQPTIEDIFLGLSLSKKEVDHV